MNSPTDPPGIPPLEKRTTWWQRAGQSVNLAGVKLFLHVRGGNETLALPHVRVTDIRNISWSALRDAGFKGCAFDKDNTLTLPFLKQVHPDIQASLDECKRVFGGNVVLFSNSAGLYQFDPDGHVAERMEGELGISVLRHSDKKPAGGAADLEKYFGCSACELVMIGDRYLTDIVYGNRNGMLTIRPAPFTIEGEPLTVKLSRRLEDRYVDQWTRRGIEAPPHKLAPTAAVLATFITLAPPSTVAAL